MEAPRSYHTAAEFQPERLHAGQPPAHVGASAGHKGSPLVYIPPISIPPILPGLKPFRPTPTLETVGTYVDLGRMAVVIAATT